MIANHNVEIEEQESGTYIFPLVDGKRARDWAMFVYKDGSAELYTKIAPHGELLGKPIKLPVPTVKVFECAIKTEPECNKCSKQLKDLGR